MKIDSKQIICFIKDHKYEEDSCDGFFLRCRTYHDEPDRIKSAWDYYYRAKLKLKWWIRKYIYSNCSICGKPERIFKKEIRNHDKCYPF